MTHPLYHVTFTLRDICRATGESGALLDLTDSILRVCLRDGSRADFFRPLCIPCSDELRGSS